MCSCTWYQHSTICCCSYTLVSSQKNLSLHLHPELFGANRMSSITYVFYSRSIALTALATVSAIHDLSLSFTCRPRSASLPLLLSDGENSSPGTSPPKQFSSWNKRPHPPTPFTPDATLSENEKVVTHPVIALQPKATMRTRIIFITMGGRN